MRRLVSQPKWRLEDAFREEMKMSALLPVVKFARVAAIAIATSAAVLTAMPAQAQPFMGGFGFGFNYGPSYGRPYDPYYSGRPYYSRPYYLNRRACMPEWQLRRAINAAGYRNVSIYGSGGFRAQATGTRGRWTYRLTVNRCTGNIISAVRISRGYSPGPRAYTPY
jgi:hypothetical protein